VREVRAAITRDIDFYSSHRPHSRLDKMTPDEFYSATLKPLRAAA